MFEVNNNCLLVCFCFCSCLGQTIIAYHNQLLFTVSKYFLSQTIIYSIYKHLNVYNKQYLLTRISVLVATKISMIAAEL